MIRTGMIVFFYSILSCLCIKAAFAEDKVEFDKLAGDLPKLIDADGSPYLVTADIFVPSGKSVTIEAGTVFLFKNFTGIHVQGILEIKGTKSAPVILTSENDKMFNPLGELNPTPYDWNGIYIHKDAIGSELVNFIIQYSVKGIVSETRFLKIENGIFKDNGRSNLTIEDEEKTVTDAPYSYSLSIKDATVDGIPVKILTDPDAPKRQWIRYSGLALFIGGGALGGTGLFSTGCTF